MVKNVSSWGTKTLLLTLIALSCASIPVFADDDGDQFRDDLFDRMRRGKVFHDRSYPPRGETDDYYYCPDCGMYHRANPRQRVGTPLR